MNSGTLRLVSYFFILASFFILGYVIQQFVDPLHGERPHEEHSTVADSTIQNGEYKQALYEADTLEKEVSIHLNDTTTEETEINAPDAVRDDERLFFEELVASYQEDVVGMLKPGKSRTDVTIRYYHHEPDGESAYALQKLGFYIHERPVEKSYRFFQSNAIFYGDSVRREDVQLVAYTLLNEGLPLKTIERSKFGNNWKAHSIEIGTDSTLVENESLTLSDIRKFSF